MKKLLRACFALCIIGIFLLLLLSSLLEPRVMTIEEIKNPQSLEEFQKVKVQAEITSFREVSPNFFIINLKDETGNITVTLNSNQNLASNPSFSKTNQIQVQGKISIYQDQIQINANKIILLDSENVA